MKKKPNIKKQINEARDAIKEIMQENLAIISTQYIKDIINKARRSIDSQRIDAIKGIDFKNTLIYKQKLNEAFAIIAYDAIEQARKEVPKAKSVKLSEFTKLPKSLQKLIQTQSALIIESQLSGIKKDVSFQYTSSYNTTDSIDLIEDDLTEAASDYVTGVSVITGSATTASQLINESRKAFFTDPEVMEELDAYEFVNGDPITEVCQDLNGTIFAKDDPQAFRYFPPLHYNCKSYVIPVLKGDLDGREIEKLKPSNSKLDDQVQLGEHKHNCGCC